VQSTPKNPATPVPMPHALIKVSSNYPIKLIIVYSPSASEIPEKKAENNEDVKLILIG